VVCRRSCVIVDGSHCHLEHPKRKIYQRDHRLGINHQVPLRQGTQLQPIAADVSGAVAAQGLTELAITMRHAAMAASLPLHLRDPMDRLLIAQAIVEDMTIVTIDGVFTSYRTRTLW
jgi:hypothetical protein